MYRRRRDGVREQSSAQPALGADTCHMCVARGFFLFCLQTSHTRVLFCFVCRPAHTSYNLTIRVCTAPLYGRRHHRTQVFKLGQALLIHRRAARLHARENSSTERRVLSTGAVIEWGLRCDRSPVRSSVRVEGTRGNGTDCEVVSHRREHPAKQVERRRSGNGPVFLRQIAGCQELGRVAKDACDTGFSDRSVLVSSKEEVTVKDF